MSEPANKCNIDTCGGLDNRDDGCGVCFPGMAPGGGLCLLCKKVKQTGLSPDEIDRILETHKQCSVCGLAGTSIKDPCGTCKRLAREKENVNDIPGDALRAKRRAIVEGRIHRPLGSATSTSIGPTTSQRELDNLRSNVGKVGTFTILSECRRSDAAGSVDKVLGKLCAPYPETTTLLDLQQKILASVNPGWTTKHPSDLQLDETELRAQGNIAFPPDTDLLTLREWYNLYNQEETRDMFIKIPSGLGKTAKGSSFSLELFIHVDRFYERTHVESSDEDALSLVTNGKKRKKSQKMRGKTSSQALKRTKGNSVSVLQSSFVPDSRPVDLDLDARTVDKIQLKRTMCTIRSDTGAYSLTESATFESAMLDQLPMAFSAADRGRTKEVYRLVIDNLDYVAKKLVDIGDGLNNIDLYEATRLLTADLIRLKRMSYFAKAFSVRADRLGAETTAFQVSDAFIIKTSTLPALDSSDSENSTLEGTSEMLNDTTEMKQTGVYLVEPLRASSAVLKFSGTLGQRLRSDKRTGTILAFSHFVLDNTACQYMFSDLQGSIDKDDQNHSVLTLFDPMTHTPQGQSGLGDHGTDGLKDFITSHSCSPICKNLQLSPLDTLSKTLDTIINDGG